MSEAEYNQKRAEIPWQFRPPMRHALSFRAETESMRGHVEEMLRQHAARMKRLAEEEAAAKAASKKGGGRPKSAKSK